MHRFALYTHSYSRDTNIVRILKECGTQYDVKLISLGEAMRSTDYLAVNPIGKVPALKADGTALTETAVIITLLTEQSPDRRLIPAADSLACDESYRWLCFSIHPEYAGFDKVSCVPDSSERRKTTNCDNLDTTLATLRDHLTKYDFIVDDRPSTLDVYFTALSNHFIRVIPVRGTSSVFTADEPIFSVYINRHTARPVFTETMTWVRQATTKLKKQV